MLLEQIWIPCSSWPPVNPFLHQDSLTGQLLPQERQTSPRYWFSTNQILHVAESGAGIDNLLSYFGENHRGVFVGPTGVGKSSIMNSILPDINLSTGEISESKKRGRHTTTVSTLHILENGGELVDSPGFNDFGLVDTTTPELALYFPGFEKAQKEPCRFRDCKHKEEPGCQVTEKVQSGEISSERYQTYLQLLEEVEMIDSEPKYRERRSRRKKN